MFDYSFMRALRNRPLALHVASNQGLLKKHLLVSIDNLSSNTQFCLSRHQFLLLLSTKKSSLNRLDSKFDKLSVLTRSLDHIGIEKPQTYFQPEINCAPVY